MEFMQPLARPLVSHSMQSKNLPPRAIHSLRVFFYLTAASVRVGRCADGHAGGCTGGGVGIHGDGGGAKDAAHEYGGNVEELEKEGLK